MLVDPSFRYTSTPPFTLILKSGGISSGWIVSMMLIPRATRYLHCVKNSKILLASEKTVKSDKESITTQLCSLKLLPMYRPITGKRNEDCSLFHCTPYMCNGMIVSLLRKNAVEKLNVIDFMFSMYSLTVFSVTQRTLLSDARSPFMNWAHNALFPVPWSPSISIRVGNGIPPPNCLSTSSFPHGIMSVN